MRARYSAALVAVWLVSGCGSGENTAAPDAAPAPATDSGATVDGGTTASVDVLLTLSDAKAPAVSARVCEWNTSNCTLADATGKAHLVVAKNADHVLEMSLSGYRTFLFPVRTDRDVERPEPLSFFTEAEDAAYYAVAGGVDAAHGTVTLRTEATTSLGKMGSEGITYEVVAMSPPTVYYANDAASALVAGRTETSISGLGGLGNLAAGTIDVRGRAKNGTRCLPYFGGFEVTVDGAPAYRIPVVAGADTRLEMRCSP